MVFTDDDVINIPIEFKKITPNDFDLTVYESTITEISPNEEGYIKDELLPILDNDFNIENTVVINAGVGQGKSEAIIEKIIDYSKSEEYVVIIAVPFYALIKQYEEDCKERGVVQNEIFNIEKIKNYNFLNRQNINDNLFVNDGSNISNFKIHIMTINSLLGNPGENSLIQSEIRTKYFDELKNFCDVNNKKIVIVFDEIHDGIQNFKEEFIYSLWNFHGLIFKIFLISATFNEASKQVIKYLSEFTKCRINIVEAKRIKNQFRQSKLNLIFNDYKAISNNVHLKRTVKELIDKKKNFDIIVYSKKQIKKLLEPNGLLYSIKDELNLCYKDIFDFSNKSDKRYDKDLINVGTNFTTGVSIKKQEHTLIVILPKRLIKNENINRGIFSSGINSIIQTLARQRNAGEIYIVMPSPYKIEKDSLPYSELINEKIVQLFDKFSLDNIVKYSNINSQGDLLKKVYDKIITRNNTATYKISIVDRSGKNNLKLPSFEKFVLESGERYLTNKFFNGDLSTYTFFAAITNQFLNCTLSEIFNDDSIEIEDGNVLNTAYEIYKDFGFRTIFGNTEDELDEPLHLYYSEYSIIKNILLFLQNKEIYINNEKVNISLKRYLKRAIMYLAIQHGSQDGVHGLNRITSIELGKILSKMYFQSVLKFSDVELLKLSNDYYIKTEFNDYYILDKETTFKIFHYKKWMEYIELIEQNIKPYKKTLILSKEPCSKFKSKFKKDNMLIEIDRLLSLDLILNEEIIPFKDTFLNTEKSKKVETFYTLLFKTFFTKNNTDVQINVSGTRIRFFKNVERKNIENLKINLLYEKIPEAIL